MQKKIIMVAYGCYFRSKLIYIEFLPFSKSNHFATFYLNIGVAPITQLRMCVIKIVTFKEGHLMW